MKYLEQCLVLLISLFILSLSSCKTDKKDDTLENTTSAIDLNEEETNLILWEPYNDSLDVAANAEHESKRMRYKFIQSKVLNKNEVFLPLYSEVSKFSEQRYQALKPLILEQDIPTIQAHISNEKFSYEELSLFYLYRIYKYELPNSSTLNTVIALNSDILKQARALDKTSEGHHPIYGMPILLKDNIGAKGMATTAGAVALKDNTADDAFIVKQLREKGALILGKVNLSEWANFLCDCPNGQSAIGGQTLNPYGRMKFDTGGSSAGSGTSTAANYAVAAVGTETSGSILSPSSQNSIVGLKPTIGLLSRTGIVPISSTLDTPGPMTKNVIDNGILIDAMRGFDEQDEESVQTDWPQDWYVGKSSLQGKKFGVFKKLLADNDSYNNTVELIKASGGKVVEIEAEEVNFDGFLSILNIDMKYDLPRYLATQVKNKDAVKVENIEDVVNFNLQDTLIRIPYGQVRFDGILVDSTTTEELVAIKQRLKLEGRKFFNNPMNAHGLDAILSINNYHAGFAAAAEYPAITVPMGYMETGEPIGLTFIAKQFQEAKLYQLASAYEAVSKSRKIPEQYQD